MANVPDSHHLDADPDKTFHFHVDSNPTSHLSADPAAVPAMRIYDHVNRPYTPIVRGPRPSMSAF